jgi:hypothetical protein
MSKSSALAYDVMYSNTLMHKDHLKISKFCTGRKTIGTSKSVISRKFYVILRVQRTKLLPINYWLL